MELALSARGGGAESSRRLAVALWGDDSDSAVVVPMVAAEELVGVLALRYAGDRRIDAEQREIATSVANQAAVAIKKVQLIDRLTERNAIKDLLEDLSHGERHRRSSWRSGRRRWAAIWRCRTWCCRRCRGRGRPRPAGSRWRSRSSRRRRGRSRGRCSTGATPPLRGLIRLGTGGEAAVAERLREIHDQSDAEASVGDRPVAIAATGPAPTRTGSARPTTRWRRPRWSAASPAWSASTTWARTSTC